MQQRLKSPPRSTRTGIVSAQLLNEFFVTPDNAIPRFTRVSDGNPLRRLLLTSKALEFEVFVLDSHDAPPSHAPEPGVQQ